MTYKIRICQHCHISVLETHPEYEFWLKCVTCGFCALDEEKFTKNPNEDKFHRRNGHIIPTSSSPHPSGPKAQ